MLCFLMQLNYYTTLEKGLTFLRKSRTFLMSPSPSNTDKLKKKIIIIITSDLGYSKTVKEYPGGSVGVFSHLILNWNS